MTSITVSAKDTKAEIIEKYEVLSKALINAAEEIGRLKEEVDSVSKRLEWYIELVSLFDSARHLADNSVLKLDEYVDINRSLIADASLEMALAFEDGDLS